MKTKKTLKKLVTGSIVGAMTLGSLATAQARDYATVREAMEVLKVKNPHMISMNLPQGYKTSKNLEGYLRLLAGIYAGTVQVKKTDKGYSAEGVYSEFKNPEAMERVLREADNYKDKIITRPEIKDLMVKLYEQYAK